MKRAVTLARTLTRAGTTAGLFSLWGLGSLCGLGAGCDYHVDGEHRLTSLRLALKTPKEQDLGTPTQSVRPTSILFDVEALDDQGALMPVDRPVQAFLAAGGGRLSLINPCATTPAGDGSPTWLLKRFDLVGGKALAVTLPLDAPAIFGRVTLNLEDPVSLAVGSTPPIFFPNPTIAQLMAPIDPSAKNATYCSPYLNRQVVIDRATQLGNGQPGKLVVSSLFANGLAVSDPGTPDYGSMYVFTFSQPSAKLQRGRIIQRLAGAVAKFNGMTQLGNPTISATDTLDVDLVPKPVELTGPPTGKHDESTSNPTYLSGKVLNKSIAAPVRVTGIVCEVVLDDSRRDNWTKYNSVSINQVDTDPQSSKGCGGVNPSFPTFTHFSVQLPGKGFANFDPMKVAGQEATFTGMLQNGVSKSGATLFWTVVVRDVDDVCVGPRAGCANAK